MAPRAILLAASISAVSASAGVGTFGPDYTPTASRLRADLLQAYDKFTPPTATRTAESGTTSRAGTDVGLQVRFFKVQEVRANEGVMRLKVWVRMEWSDTRLAWDPAAYDGIEQVTMPS